MSMRYGRNNPWRTFESSILEATDISVYEKMAYIVISSHATSTNQRSWPSYSTIAIKGSMSVRKARDAVKSLEDKHLIVKVHRFANRTRNGKSQNEYTSNLYVIFPYSEPFDPSKEIIDKNGEVIQISSAHHALPHAQDAPPPSAQCAPPVVHNMHLKNKTSINKTNIINKTIQQQEEPKKGVVEIKNKYESLFQKTLTDKQAEDLLTLADKHSVNVIHKIENTYKMHLVEPCKSIVASIKHAIVNGDWEINSPIPSASKNITPMPKDIAKQREGITSACELTREELDAKKAALKRKIDMLEKEAEEYELSMLPDGF